MLNCYVQAQTDTADQVYESVVPMRTKQCLRYSWEIIESDLVFFCFLIEMETLQHKYISRLNKRWQDEEGKAWGKE